MNQRAYDCLLVDHPSNGHGFRAVLFGAVDAEFDQPRHGVAAELPQPAQDVQPIVAFGNLEGLLASVRSDTLKLIVRPTGRRRPELYDLSQDPEEQANLGEQRTAELEALYQELVLFERASSERSPARSMRLDEEHLETLRSLGYVK